MKKESIKIFLSADEKTDYKINAAKQGKALYKYILEQLESIRILKDELKKNIQEKQDFLAKKGGQMSAEERQKLKDNIHTLKEKLYSIGGK